jgi:hypothetical protein
MALSTVHVVAEGARPEPRRGESPAIEGSAWERPALASGVVFAVLQLAAFVFFGATLGAAMPPLGATHAQHAAFYADYRDTLTIANYLFLVPTPFFLVFLGGLAEALRRAEARAGVLTVAAVGAGAALAMTWPLAILVAGAGQSMAREGLDAVSVVTFDAVAQLGLALSGFPRAVFLAAASLALLGTGRRALGWSGLAAAALALAGTAALVVNALYPVAVIGMLAFLAWTAAGSGALATGAGSPGAATSLIATTGGPPQWSDPR